MKQRKDDLAAPQKDPAKKGRGQKGTTPEAPAEKVPVPKDPAKKGPAKEAATKKGRKKKTPAERAAFLKALAVGLAAAVCLVAIAALGGLDKADQTLADALYQRRAAADGNIVIVGIDRRALEAYGPYNQWGRGLLAQVVETLNADPDARPAVIALDVLFAGETDPAQDARLAAAAQAGGNVLCASVASFGSALGEAADGSYYLDTFAVLGYEQPYAALAAASTQGHINAMLDTDGILRHHLLELVTPDGQRAPSMALAAAEAYAASRPQAAPLTLPPTDANGFWYLPYCGAPGDLSSGFSVADILTGAFSAASFADKIVLIGPYAAGLQDSYFTAIDHAAPMYGVEYQANAIQALLWGDYKREAADTWQLAVLFVVLLAAFAAFWRRKVAVATAVWAVLSGGWLGGGLLAWRQGLVLHPLWVPAGVSVLYVGCIAWNYTHSALEKRRVTNTFRRYVAPEIVTELLREGPEALQLGGRTTSIAVLFVDVRGFTPMSELLDPPQVVEILNRYLTLISRCILENGGTLDKFVGDAAMAFWGAPLPQEDYVMHAAAAALDMVAGAQALSRELLEKYGRTVAFGIGIHVGEAVVGNIGSPQRMDYTAIGDTVNTAARLEANAPGGSIYISRAVADALAGRVRTTSLGAAIKLKGKKEGFEILTLDGLA